MIVYQTIIDPKINDETLKNLSEGQDGYMDANLSSDERIQLLIDYLELEQEDNKNNFLTTQKNILINKKKT